MNWYHGSVWPIGGVLVIARRDIIESRAELLGGVAVFKGTRVPVRTLMDYLEAGDRLDDFLADFPTVTREQAVQALELASQALLDEPHEDAA